jgi:hypothetical protein
MKNMVTRIVVGTLAILFLASWSSFDSTTGKAGKPHADRADVRSTKPTLPEPRSVKNAISRQFAAVSRFGFQTI